MSYHLDTALQAELDYRRAALHHDAERHQLARLARRAARATAARLRRRPARPAATPAGREVPAGHEVPTPAHV